MKLQMYKEDPKFRKASKNQKSHISYFKVENFLKAKAKYIPFINTQWMS